jgi:hypothetical protein
MSKTDLLQDSIAQELLHSRELARLAYTWTDGTDVSLTIDTSVFPYHVLLVRGVVEMEHVVGAPSEVAAAAERYLGPDQGRAWMDQAGGLFKEWVRLAVVPTFVQVIDYEARMPSAIATAIAGQSSI